MEPRSCCSAPPPTLPCLGNFSSLGVGIKCSRSWEMPSISGAAPCCLRDFRRGTASCCSPSGNARLPRLPVDFGLEVDGPSAWRAWGPRPSSLSCSRFLRVTGRWHRRAQPSSNWKGHQIRELTRVLGVCLPGNVGKPLPLILGEPIILLGL